MNKNVVDYEIFYICAWTMHFIVHKFPTCALSCAYFLIMYHNSILIVLLKASNFQLCYIINNLCTQKVHRSCLDFLCLKHFFINAFTSQKRQRQTWCFCSHGTGPYVGQSILHTDQYHAEKRILVKNYFITMTLFIFLPSHASDAVEAAMVIAPCSHSLHDIITFVAVLG